jgi:hypothetical protein
MTNISKLQAQLEKLSIPPDDIAIIVDEVAQGDARSLFSEIAIRSLWGMVIDEIHPELLIPKNRSNTVNRLMESGTSLDDIVDVIRETQVTMIEQMAQFLDWPMENISLDRDLKIGLSANFDSLKSNPLPLYEIHSCIMDRDPAGRGGSPRTLEVRQLQKLKDPEKSEIIALIRGRQFSVAALKWKSQFGGELRVCLAAVQSLVHQLPHAG